MGNGGNFKGGNDQSIQGEIAQREKEKQKILQDLIKNNPITKATYKALEESTIAHVQEAVASGMPNADILASAHQQAGIPMPQQIMGQTAQPASIPSPYSQPGVNTTSASIPSPYPRPESGMTTQASAVPTQGQPMSTEDQIKNNVLNQLLQASQPKGFWGRMQQNMAKTSGNITDADTIKNLLDIQEGASGTRLQNNQSLIRNRNLESDLMEKQLQGGDTNKVYRDPVTGEEVDSETAQEDMKNGLGIYQLNQKLSTRAGVVERPLNKVPDLTEGEKKYVNDARIIDQTLETLGTGFDKMYGKFGKANWQSFQMEKIPYVLAQDQDVQDLKSDLISLKAAIPFLRGGKALTPTEAKRVDVMLNPFGKNKETYHKDLNRFQNEFISGAEIQKFGINAGFMKKYIKGKSGLNKLSKEEPEPSNNLKSKYGLE